MVRDLEWFDREGQEGLLERFRLNSRGNVPLIVLGEGAENELRVGATEAPTLGPEPPPGHPGGRETTTLWVDGFPENCGHGAASLGTHHLDRTAEDCDLSGKHGILLFPFVPHLP